MATRIKLLAPGTVQFSITIHPDAVGKVEIEPSKNSWTKNGSNSGSSSPAKEGIGKIIYELNGLNLEIPLHANDCDLRDFPRKGDIVRYCFNSFTFYMPMIFITDKNLNNLLYSIALMS